ncbi:hypothetical protein I6N96_07075 [Enterococcus sp. BWM-S5]|uniref:Toxin n=1 Tax=Enterococcus larvae TaxID=2794352 RepID=A0ABS4CHY0_9ENTE|nr:hypothetical protein [Enterococcus larvae]MBP1046040.1 hypothetical protein [Enterococcus larvae]
MKTYIERLKQASQQQFITIAFNRDRIGRRLTEAQQENLCQLAQAEGERLGTQLRQDFPEMLPSEIAKIFGVAVTYKEYTIHESFTSIGYFEIPNQIVVNQKLKEKDSYFKEQGLTEMQFDRWKEIVIAHELFHYIQEQTEELFVNQYRVELWKLGPYHHQSSFSLLGEIAGMSFAKSLLSLDYYPGLIEWYLLYAYFPEKMKQQSELLFPEA